MKVTHMKENSSDDIPSMEISMLTHLIMEVYLDRLFLKVPEVKFIQAADAPGTQQSFLQKSLIQRSNAVSQIVEVESAQLSTKCRTKATATSTVSSVANPPQTVVEAGPVDPSPARYQCTTKRSEFNSTSSSHQ